MTNILKIGKSEEKHNESLPFFLLWVYSMGIMKNTNTTTYIKDDRISMQMQQSHWKNDAEYVALVEDLIYHEELLHMETITHHHFTNRLEHSIRVSYKSYQLAKKWELDARATARAGLLHDFFHEDRDAVAQLNLGSHADAHPKIACENACRITEISSLERDIILKPLWPAALQRKFCRNLRGQICRDQRGRRAYQRTRRRSPTRSCFEIEPSEPEHQHLIVHFIKKRPYRKRRSFLYIVSRMSDSFPVSDILQSYRTDPLAPKKLNPKWVQLFALYYRCYLYFLEEHVCYAIA